MKSNSPVKNEEDEYSSELFSKE